jgi:translation elongation factor EF-G
VRKSIEFSQELRSHTSGRVFWQTIFDSFQPVPPEQQEQIIQDIRFRKGLLFVK